MICKHNAQAASEVSAESSFLEYFTMACEFIRVTFSFSTSLMNTKYSGYIPVDSRNLNSHPTQ